MSEKKDVIKMMRNGESVSMADPDYAAAAAVIAETWKRREDFLVFGQA